MEMDFLAEFEELGEISNKVIVAYKFLNLFKVHLEGEKRGGIYILRELFL